MKTINQLQDEIIEEFSLLDGDPEMTVFYIMELGQKLPPMPDADKTDDNLVKGCQSKVWLTARMEEGRVWFAADSNTAITRGLVSMLIRIFNGQKPEDILEAELYFITGIHLDRYIGTQRSNGFAAMIKQMKWYALALKTKQEV
ncbi:MAG: Fe-S metabolism protein SufE [Cyclobacteriaceae bacterium]|nr:MAG: Fe-S metabolism protein SufE [Cyclobacteriaceae bacterium]